MKLGMGVALIYLGIDIGGTGIKAALVNELGQIVNHVETPTRASEGASAVLGRVELLSRSLMGKMSSPVLGCGVGSAGRIDHRRGHVVFASRNLPGWTGLALGSELSGRLGLPVAVDNDVNVAAMAEGWIGGARGTSDYLMVTIGTGVGGALVMGGNLWRGARSGAGEVGHMVLYPGGRPCNCGGTGCAEQYVSAKALTRRANEAQGSGHPFRGIRDVIAAIERGKGHRRGSVSSRVQRHAALEPGEDAGGTSAERSAAARGGVEGFTADLALLLVNLQQAFDPQITIVGGGIVKLGYWWDRLLEAVAREGRSRSLTVRLKKADCGPQAGVIGAARLAMLAPPRMGRSPARVGPMNLPLPHVKNS